MQNSEEKEERASFGSLEAISAELSVCLARLRIILGRVYGGIFCEAAKQLRSRHAGYITLEFEIIAIPDN